MWNDVALSIVGQRLLNEAGLLMWNYMRLLGITGIPASREVNVRQAPGPRQAKLNDQI